MSALLLNDPQQIRKKKKRTTRPIMLDFDQTAVEPFSVFECWLSQTSLISVTTGSCHAKLPALLLRRGPLSETEYPPCGMQILLHVFDIWEQWSIQWVSLHHWFYWCLPFPPPWVREGFFKELHDNVTFGKHQHHHAHFQGNKNCRSHDSRGSSQANTASLTISEG